MKTHWRSKLKDYLEGLNSLKGGGYFPLGCVIIEKENHTETLGELAKSKLQIIKTKGVHKDFVSSDTASALNHGRKVVIDMVDGKEDGLTKFLEQLRDNRIEPFSITNPQKTILNLLPKKTFALILTDKDSYKEMKLGDVPSSYCNLTR